MGIKRSIDTALWSNPVIVDTFTAEDKYFWLYLLTSPHNSICGVAKISALTIANEMGYSRETIVNLLNRFFNVHKLIYHDAETSEYIILDWWVNNWSTSSLLMTNVNTQKMQIESETIRMLIEERIDNVDCENKCFKGNKLSSVDTLSIPYRYPSISNTNTNTIINKELSTISNIDIIDNKGIDIKTSTNKTKKKKEKEIERYFENDELNDLLIEFIDMRKKMKSVMTDRAINMMIKKINSYDEGIAVKMLENAIFNNWKDIYPLKPNELWDNGETEQRAVGQPLDLNNMKQKERFQQ